MLLTVIPVPPCGGGTQLCTNSVLVLTVCYETSMTDSSGVGLLYPRCKNHKNHKDAGTKTSRHDHRTQTKQYNDRTRTE